MGDDARPYADRSLAEFSAAVASVEPVPGGGSVSAVAGGLAASLVAMVVRLSQDRPKYAAFAPTHARALGVADAARVQFLQLADEDAAAYAAFGEARRAPDTTPEEKAARAAAVSAAALRAAEVPLRIVRECHALVEEIDALAGRSNLNAASDLEVAGLLAEAAARGAGTNVLVNLPSVGDQRLARTMLPEVEGRLHEIDSAVARVHAQVRSGNLRSPQPT